MVGRSEGQHSTATNSTATHRALRFVRYLPNDYRHLGNRGQAPRTLPGLLLNRQFLLARLRRAFLQDSPTPGGSLRFAHRGLISFTPPACKPAARKGCEAMHAESVRGDSLRGCYTPANLQRSTTDTFGAYVWEPRACVLCKRAFSLTAQTRTYGSLRISL